MSIALELAQRITEVTYDSLPPDAIRWAKMGILDTVGVTLAGAREDAARLAARALGSSPGPSYVFGTAARVNPLDAALVNGAASHALDFDDCNNTFGGHPSAPFCPRCLRWLTKRAPAAATSSPPTSPASKRKPRSRSASIFITT